MKGAPVFQHRDRTRHPSNEAALVTSTNGRSASDNVVSLKPESQRQTTTLKRQAVRMCGCGPSHSSTVKEDDAIGTLAPVEELSLGEALCNLSP